jgi:hypothetical protein
MWCSTWNVLSLYFLYVNDIDSTIPEHHVKRFAGETSIYIAGKTQVKLTANEARKC